MNVHATCQALSASAGVLRVAVDEVRPRSLLQTCYSFYVDTRSRNCAKDFCSFLELVSFLCHVMKNMTCSFGFVTLTLLTIPQRPPTSDETSDHDDGCSLITTL